MAQALLLLAIAPKDAMATPREARLVALLAYLTLALVLVVRVRGAGVELRMLLGERVDASLRPLLFVVVPIGLLTIAAAIATYIPLSFVAPGFVRQMLETDSDMLVARSVVGWLEVVLVAVVVAPVVEELLFRGVLLHRWAHRWGTARAVVASSALFAVLHAEWLGHFLFGVAMCALYLRTRSLWMPIVAHAISNGVAVLLGLYEQLHPGPPHSNSLAEIRGQWPQGLAALLAGALLLWWYVHRWWPDGRWRAVLRGPVPYDVARGAIAGPSGIASSLPTPASTSAS